MVEVPKLPAPAPAPAGAVVEAAPTAPASPSPVPEEVVLELERGNDGEAVGTLVMTGAEDEDAAGAGR